MYISRYINADMRTLICVCVCGNALVVFLIRDPMIQNILGFGSEDVGLDP